MLAAFTAGLLLITISELGDKTFFIAVILAMRHSRRLVFLGVLAALAAMTLLSVMLGQVVSLLPKKYIDFGEIALFLGFGLKLIYDASRMPAKSENAGAKEAAAEVEKQNEGGTVPRWAKVFSDFPQLAIWLQAFVMTFIAEWGDRTQISTIALAASYQPVEQLSILTNPYPDRPLVDSSARSLGNRAASRVLALFGQNLSTPEIRHAS